MIVQFVVIFTIITIFIYFLNMWKIYTYWKRKGVNGPTPYPIVGNYASVIFGKECEGDFLHKIYKQYPNERFVGIFKGIRPVLVLRDPSLYEFVFTKDFDHFSDRNLEKPLQFMQKNVFISRGNDYWHSMRIALSPIFTKAKCAKMIPPIKKAMDKYIEFVDNLIDNNIEYEIRDLKRKLVVESIGNLILGVDLNTFDGRDKFQNEVQETLDSHIKTTAIHKIAYTFPGIVDMIVPIMKVYFERRVVGSFRKFIYSLMYKPKGGTIDNTILDILLNLKEQSYKQKGKLVIDYEDVFQQIATFSLTSYESLSKALAIIILMLAHHQDIQEKAYQEIENQFKICNGDINEKFIYGLQYLEMIINESMRLHSPSQSLERKCIKRYTFPDSNLTIDKRIYVTVPSYGLYRDPKFYENPNVFDPERFSPENKSKIQHNIFMPFGKGPRMCLGSKLSTIFILLCTSSFLLKYKVYPSSKTQKPLKYDPSAQFSTAPLGGIFVKLEPRK